MLFFSYGSERIGGRFLKKAAGQGCLQASLQLVLNVRGTSARKDKAMHTLVAPNGLRMPPNASTWTQWPKS